MWPEADREMAWLASPITVSLANMGDAEVFRLGNNTPNKVVTGRGGS